MTAEKMEINSEICQVYTAAPPDTQNFLEPIKITPSDNRKSKVKIRADLKPDTLSVDSTPVEYKFWAKSWRVFNLGSNYSIGTRTATGPHTTRQGPGIQTPKQNLRRHPQIPNAQARFKGGSVMEVLEKIFRESNPVFRQRCELIHLKANKGEKLSSYMSRLIGGM